MLVLRIPTIFVLAILISFITSEVSVPKPADSLGVLVKRHGHGHGRGHGRGHGHGHGHGHGGGWGKDYGHGGGGGWNKDYGHGGGGGWGKPKETGCARCGTQPGPSNVGQVPGPGYPPQQNNYYYGYPQGPGNGGQVTLPAPGAPTFPIHLHINGGGGGDAQGGGNVFMQTIMAKLSALLVGGGGMTNNFQVGGNTNNFQGNSNLQIVLQSFKELLLGSQLQALLIKSNVDMNVFTSQLIAILSEGNLNAQSFITQVQQLCAKYHIILNENKQNQVVNSGGAYEIKWTVEQML